jgi:hypothetical protein
MAKEPRDPAFPHPALEVGVPQYPTPNVPDFYKRDGHIILVEKITTEKGTYNPLPLDGSVIYSNIDAKKWPSELYLVAERPTPDGMFCYRFWANDRTMASQDPWNYGVSYSDNDPEYPVYIRQYIVPRDQYTPIAKGSIDPIFGGNAIVAQQQMQELDDENPLRSRYVQMVVQYESIPGPVVVGKQINQRGDVETVEVQTVAAGTAPDTDSFLITSSSVDPVDSIKSKRKKSSVTTYTTLTSKEKKSGILGITTSTDDMVEPSTEPDALSATVLQSSVQQISKTKARKVTTSIDNTITLGGAQKREGLLGEVRTSESIVPANTLPDALTTTVVSSQVDPIDSVKSKKTTITAIGPSSLVGGESKGGLLGNTAIQESIVSAGTSPDALSASILESKVTPIDSGKSRKTTISSTGPLSLQGSSKKQGLLGNTKSTKSIVSYGADPDQLSITTLESEVTPIDSFKSQKVTITSDGPTSLTGGQNKGGLLGNTTIEKSIVAAGSSPDALSTTILDSSVDPIDAYKSQKTTILSTGPTLLSGKENKSGLLGYTTISESIVDAGASPDALSATVLDSRITPIDSSKSKKTTSTASGPTTLEGAKRNQRGDIETVVKSIVAYNTQPTQDSYLLQSSEVDPIDEFKSQKVDMVVNQYSTISGNSYQMGGGVGAAGGAEKVITNTIVDPYTYTTPDPKLTTLSYQEKPISKNKIEVITESLVDADFPKINSSEIDPISHTGVFSTYTQIVNPGQTASAEGGIVKEYADLDKWHSQLTHKDYSSLVDLQWIEYENESYAPPAKLYITSNGSILGYLQDIYSYVRPQPRTITARVEYKIVEEAEAEDCFNPITQTLITDVGTFTNVLHNAVQYVGNGELITAQPSIPNSTALPNEIIYRFSCTRIPRMGGLYLSRRVVLPFASLYSANPES